MARQPHRARTTLGEAPRRLSPRPSRRSRRAASASRQRLPPAGAPLQDAARRDRPDREARAHHRLRRGEGARARTRGAGIGRPQSERRIVDAADLWLAKHPAAGGLDLRYDMVVVHAVAAAAPPPRRLPARLQQGLVDCASMRRARLTRRRRRRPGMTLNVAVQMDHISKITIAGDTTFALMLEAERRGHTLYHYTPDRLAHARWPRRGARRAGQGARP